MTVRACSNSAFPSRRSIIASAYWKPAPQHEIGAAGLSNPTCSRQHRRSPEMSNSSLWSLTVVSSFGKRAAPVLGLAGAFRPGSRRSRFRPRSDVSPTPTPPAGGRRDFRRHAARRPAQQALARPAEARGRRDDGPRCRGVDRAALQARRSDRRPTTLPRLVTEPMQVPGYLVSLTVQDPLPLLVILHLRATLVATQVVQPGTDSIARAEARGDRRAHRHREGQKSSRPRPARPSSTPGSRSRSRCCSTYSHTENERSTTAGAFELEGVPAGTAYLHIQQGLRGCSRSESRCRAARDRPGDDRARRGPGLRRARAESRWHPDQGHAVASADRREQRLVRLHDDEHERHGRQQQDFSLGPLETTIAPAHGRVAPGQGQAAPGGDAGHRHSRRASPT